MKQFGFLFAPLVGSVLGGLAVGLLQDAPDQTDAKQLKELISGLGYEVKDLNSDPGKEKYEFTVTNGGYDIPVGAEITPSKTYIWLTANLGADSDTKPHRDLLKQNFKVQPSQFYITSGGALMIGLPIENKGITPTYLKSRVDKFAADVANSADLWSK